MVRSRIYSCRVLYIGHNCPVVSINWAGLQLKKLPRGIDTLTNLKVLNVGSNDLDRLPLSLANISVSLRHLDYSLNPRMPSFPPVLYHLKQLRYLQGGLYVNTERRRDHGYTHLGNPLEFDIDRFDMPHLKILNMASAMLWGPIPPKLPLRLRNIERLSLARNNIIALPSQMGLLTKLTSLYLHDSKDDIVLLPSELSELSNLRQLSLSEPHHRCNYKPLPASFSKLKFDTLWVSSECNATTHYAPVMKRCSTPGVCCFGVFPSEKVSTACKLSHPPALMTIPLRVYEPPICS